MGGYNSAQIADLVGLYILNTLGRIADPIHIRLYRDDSSLYIPNSDGPKCSSIQKKIIRIFKFLGFKIEISSNIKIANFLDITLNLSDNSYRPFLKTNQYPSYINVNTNHPSSIIKQIPKAVNMRTRRLSSNKKSFHERSKMYFEALKNCGFKEEFIYLEPKKMKPNNNDLYKDKETTDRCPWCNGYCRRIWTRRHEFKSWTSCISHSTNTLGKGMNPIILPPAMGK